MHLVVGLGNPGSRYSGTRHNVGFHVVERLCARWGIDPTGRSWLGSQLCDAIIKDGVLSGVRAVLARPQQFMNRSGQPVAALARFYQVNPDRIVVIHDEMGLAPSVIRCRTGGGHGGHNGLRDIIQHIGREFLRLRVGIGRPTEGVSVTDHVLGTWTESEHTLLDHTLETACDAVEVILSEGMTAAQNRFNVRPKPPKSPKSPKSPKTPEASSSEASSSEASSSEASSSEASSSEASSSEPSSSLSSAQSQSRPETGALEQS